MTVKFRTTLLTWLYGKGARLPGASAGFAIHFERWRVPSGQRESPQATNGTGKGPALLPALPDDPVQANALLKTPYLSLYIQWKRLRCAETHQHLAGKRRGERGEGNISVIAEKQNTVKPHVNNQLWAFIFNLFLCLSTSSLKTMTKFSLPHPTICTLSTVLIAK